MTKDQLWREIIRQNPQIPEQGLNLSPSGLMKLFNLVWDVAYEYGKEVTCKNPFSFFTRDT